MTVCTSYSIEISSVNLSLIPTVADAVTFFHEFGHAVHGLLSRTQFSKFHGTRFVCQWSHWFHFFRSRCANCGGVIPSVARDFVEAPSQMLENWGWEPKVLKKISSHYKTQEPLPDDLIQRLIKRSVRVFFINLSRSGDTRLDHLAIYKLFFLQQSICQRGAVLPSTTFLRHV